MLQIVRNVIFNYSNGIFGILLVLLIVSLVVLILSSQNLLTPKQNRRILKLRIKPYEAPKPSKYGGKFTPKILLKELSQSAGFEGEFNQVVDVFKGFALVSFLFSGMLVFMLGFSFVSSVVFASISMALSPLVPIIGLVYRRAVRNSLLTEEIFVVMTHVIDAVHSAGKTLQGGLEDSLYAAPTLRPYLRQFLNTYLMIGLHEAVGKLREKIKLSEMELFLDLISHGFEHTPQELLRYFESESDAYHELELTSKQRRMDRREVMFDVVVVLPFIIGFLLMIYPVFMQGMQAISHSI